MIDLHSPVIGEHRPTLIIEAVRMNQFDTQILLQNFSDFSCLTTCVYRTEDNGESTDLGNLYNDGILVDELGNNTFYVGHINAAFLKHHAMSESVVNGHACSHFCGGNTNALA